MRTVSFVSVGILGTLPMGVKAERSAIAVAVPGNTYF
jgi:hypothetical protein